MEIFTVLDTTEIRLTFSKIFSCNAMQLNHQSSYRCKLLSLNALKSTSETPPKSPRKLEPPPSLTSLNIMEIEKQSENKKELKIFDDVFTVNTSSMRTIKVKTNSKYLLKNIQTDIFIT